ncbi:uncharacterized protein K441DRAFT_659515 [Cenococcum geophilum 1.58]|uniref:uncharacterized protein n=1 Tax=Cenococcum geophilum 1.58 TaxID=794803 RepID=UPI0035901C60|nr:hypothetical protein K441DRAFT_659515 [Cenococcum geophilum 1.58]
MVTTRWLIFTAIPAMALPSEPINVLKRSSALKDRQECENPNWIPACPGLFACIPPGGICCSDGYTYVMPPETCPDGTEPVATAITVLVPAPTITVAPTSVAASSQIYYNYIWYTTEITWYYWWYYYTYYALSTVVSSTEITTYTTISVSATDSVEASALFSSLTYTMNFPTPTQATTSLIGVSPTPPLRPTSTSTPTPATLSVIKSASTAPTTTTSLAVFTGAATALRTSATVFWSGTSWVIGAAASIPGVMMMWL